jgi:hypothetical protein
MLLTTNFFSAQRAVGEEPKIKPYLLARISKHKIKESLENSAIPHTPLSEPSILGKRKY